HGHWTALCTVGTFIVLIPYLNAVLPIITSIYFQSESIPCSELSTSRPLSVRSAST
ncbi:hypothetical protein BDZ89DRAFT_1071254, partial [Hymenopellis radicata]